MTVTPQQRLREIRDEASGIAAKGVEFTDADGIRFEELMAEADRLRTQTGRLDKFDEVKGWMDQSAAAHVPLVSGSTPAGETVLETSPGRDGAMRVKLVDQYGAGIVSNAKFMATTTTEYADAFRQYLKFGELAGSAALKTLQEGQDAEGGFLATPEFLDMIIQKTATPTRIASRVVQLNSAKDTLVVPRVNYTADDVFTTGIRSTWTTEVPISSTSIRSTDPIFGQTRIPVHTNMLSVPVTNDLIEDASFDLMGWLAGKFGETIELLRDSTILNGTGQGQPNGILPAAGAGAQNAATVNIGNPITGDGLISLGFSLPEQYDTGAVYVFSKTQTGPVVAKLKDSNGRYLWGAGLQDSGLSPDLHNRRLLGYEVLFSEFMPGPGSANKLVLFGDPKGYYLVNRIGISVRVLNEIYAETNQVLVLGRVRFGGTVAEPWRLKIGIQS